MTFFVRILIFKVSIAFLMRMLQTLNINVYVCNYAWVEIQKWTIDYIRLLFYELKGKRSDIERTKLTLKMLPASWILLCFGKGIRSFYARKMKSVGQKASKLLAIKFGGLPTGPSPTRTNWPGFVITQGRIILKVWWQVTLQSFDLETQNVKQYKNKTFQKSIRKIESLAAF